MFLSVAFISVGTKFRSENKEKVKKIMKRQNENTMKETQTVFVLTMALMNILLLVVIGQTIWLAHSVLYNERFLQSMVFGNFLP